MKERYGEIKRSIFGKSANPYMAEQVSLLDGFILLAALDDGISESRNGNRIEKLKRIRAMVYLRNNSIFAHGLGPVGKEPFEKFKKFVMELFEEFCLLENIDYRAYRRKMVWVDPLQSIYYVGLEE